MQSATYRKINNGWVIFLFLLPLFSGMILFEYIPLMAAMYNSMQIVNLMNPDTNRFVGLANYAALVSNARFIHSLGNSLLYIAGKLLVQLPMAMLLALLVNQNIRGRTILRGALFAPLVTSEVVIAVLWNALYFPNIGVFNSILNRLGLPAYGFMTSSALALPSILVVIIWMDVGFSMLLFLAGLQSIPPDFYEAAAIDGAGWWQGFRSITLPLMKRTILLAAFMVTLSGFRVFTPIYIMTQGGPQDASISAIYLIYEQAFKYLDMGSASAMAVVMMLILAAITLGENRLLRTELEY
jgi:ABC-type sugar transport system permease subunit